MSKIPSEGAGKGDTPRPVNKKNWDEGYNRIFGKKKCNLSHKHDKECGGDDDKRT